MIRLGEVSRICLERETRSLKERFNFPARIRESLRTKPLHWLVGGLAAGLVGSGMFRRRRRPAPASSKTAETAQKGLLLTLLGLAFGAARPLAQAWLSHRIRTYVVARTGGLPTRRARTASPYNPNF